MPLFQFESDFADSLHCIPMVVRFKLDTCGVKLKLVHWNQFTPAERQSLIDLPCDPGDSAIAYSTHVQNLVQQYTGAPASTLPLEPTPPWLASTVPPQVHTHAATVPTEITDTQWSHLAPLQRFVLIKLSRPDHENRNFIPALQEFGLMESRR